MAAAAPKFAFRHPDTAAWTAWRRGIRLPSGLLPPPRPETALTPEQRADMGLLDVTVDPVPEGKIATAWTLTDVDGAPHWTPILEDAPPPPVPHSITRRQVILALVAAEIITPEEGKAAAATGTVPAAVQAVFDQLDPDEKLAAEITWATMSVAERDHPLVAALAAANEMDEAAIDDFFRTAAAI